MTEFTAYCKRMGYTEEKMRSIRYKMSLFDEFMKNMIIENDIWRQKKILFQGLLESLDNKRQQVKKDLP